MAQTMYKWVDEKGVTHFSENPPPDGNKTATKIQVKPVGGERPAAPPPETWRQKALESKQQGAKKEVDDEKTKKRQEEMRAEKCRDAQREYDAMNNSRVFHVNEKGERIYLEEKERFSRLQDAKAGIKEHCNT